MLKKTMFEIIILILLIIAIGVSGQLFLKKGLTEIGQIKLTNLEIIAQNIVKMLTNKLVIIGIICSIVSAFFWLVVLSQVNLSLAYPLVGGLFYIVLFFASWLILKESVSFIHLLGVMVIVIGIILLTRAWNGIGRLFF